jgi:hypothetical protein
METKSKAVIVGIAAVLLIIGFAVQQASTSLAQSAAGTASDAEIKYDSGNPRGNTIPLSDSPGGEIAVRFTPPWYPARIQAVRFYITSWGKPNTPFGVRIYAADKGTLPGTRLDDATLRGAGTKGNEWVEVDVSNQNIIIKDGDFFASMYWIKAPGRDVNNAPVQYLAPDFTGRTIITPDFSGYAFRGMLLKKGENGDWTIYKDRDQMMRVLVKKVM